MYILLTGGAGYIGSHTAVVLAQAGHSVILFDNLSNSQTSVIKNIERILSKSVTFIEGDVRDTKLLTETIVTYKIEVVIHFAGLKSVASSIQHPRLYYSNNVEGTISLVKAMQIAGLRKIVFSSSASVYGKPKYLPYDESHPCRPTNPYGKTKLQIEELLRNIASKDDSWSIICLRYFNPVGAHHSGLIGDNPNGIPNNLMPYISKVACGELPELCVFGNDYETKDGTGERDYIHIMDIAEGHMNAIYFLEKNLGWHAINLGKGISHSVMELVASFEKVNSKIIPVKFLDRRSGDLAVYYAKPELAKTLLQWCAKRSLDEMCQSAWNFQVNLKKNL